MTINESKYNYKRRKSQPVAVGNAVIGGDAEIVIQSMTNTDTNNIEASAAQVAEIAAAGAALVRLTTQGVREAEALGGIRQRLEELGCRVPVSADVHFNPKAAFKAAETAHKVRINPGNFVDAARTFQKLEFTDEEYAGELRRIEEQLVPFLELCRQNNVAVRLGVNHGSLSDRIMSRYGDTPAGMVESVMEYLRIARSVGFDRIVISIKASNTSVMVNTVRLLVEEMEREGMEFPLHLGVTEAGDAEDGRIKSAIGIGALLAEGIGDTIRVSLSEDPVNEIPVALELRNYITARQGHAPIAVPSKVIEGATRDAAEKIAGARLPLAMHADKLKLDAVELDAASDPAEAPRRGVIILRSHHANPVGEIKSWIDRYTAHRGKAAVIAAIAYDEPDLEKLMIHAGADFGALLLSGYCSGIEVDDPHFPADKLAELELAILQGTRLRMTRTEFIACPSCGRTLFDLQSTLREVKEHTAKYPGLKIGVMGCIVNGPGEMADADYGYVGAGPGRVSIYRSKELVKKNIPTSEALPALIELIESDMNNSIKHT